MKDKRPHDSRILSLKWKALILTSLVLVGITASFTFYSNNALRDQFERERADVRERHAHEARELIAQSMERMKQFAALVPSLLDVSGASASGDGNQIEVAFGDRWAELQIHMDLDLACFYDAANNILGGWGPEGLKKDTKCLVSPWVREANRTESSGTALDCNEKCVQYAVEPLLMHGEHIGVALFGRSLTDLILDLNKISGADVGLLNTFEFGDTPPAQTGKWLGGWRASLAALTDFERNIDLVKAISERHHLGTVLSHSVETEFEGKHYEVTLLPLNGYEKQTNAYFIVISDITRPLNQIASTIRENILIGTSGLLVSELLLLGLLWTPMNRLRRTAKTLPLLGQREFERARNAIQKRGRSRWMRDEIDILDATAVDLSHRLETLEGEIQDRTRSLAERMNELQSERDFISGLLDTAHVIILTQNAKNRITMINDYGQTLSGFRREELIDKDFLSLIAMDEPTGDTPEHLAEIATAKRDQFRHEAKLICNNGSSRDVAWLHSRLGDRGTGGPVVLSVGLDVTEQKEAEQRLSWLADHDPLTGLFNRRGFQQELERTLATSKRYDNPGALLFFDLDHFKYINDTSGHRAGDILLKMVAENLARIVRDTDVIGRLGGDEFAVLMVQTERDGATKAVRKISEHLNKLELPFGERSHKVSASIGVALFPKHGTEVPDLLAVADIAMYQAKDLGRGRWHVFSELDQSRERIHAHVYWKERVEKALAADRFVLYYQPIADLRTDKITHAEALLRMIDTDGTVIPPESFIGVCERTGLIHEIDHLVMRKGIAQAADLIAAGRNIRVSLNLSGRAFEDPDLLETLQESLTRYQVNPNWIIFEITETAAVADLSGARGLMNSMRGLGCRFALDDFGTGFSSLRYLKQLPVDYVKLDGSFIRDLPNSDDDQILVKAMAEVARGFGKKTIAEYVETADVPPLLRKYGVDLAQGYFVGRPTDLSSTPLYSFARGRDGAKPKMVEHHHESDQKR